MLFIDVDSTLILYPHEDTGDGRDWQINGRLLRAIKKYCLSQSWANERQMVVWSGGGRAYAETWLERISFISHVLLGAEPCAKIPSVASVLVRSDDLCIDDALEFAAPCRVVTQEQFIKEWD